MGARVGVKEENIRVVTELLKEINYSLLVFNIEMETGTLLWVLCQIIGVPFGTQVPRGLFGLHRAEGGEGPPPSCLLSAECDVPSLLK